MGVCLKSNVYSVRFKNVSCSKIFCHNPDQEQHHQLQVVAVDPDQDQKAAAQFVSLLSHPPH